MERAKIIPTALAVASFVGEHLVGGWDKFPPLPQPEPIVRPARLIRLPENIILGEE